MYVERIALEPNGCTHHTTQQPIEKYTRFRLMRQVLQRQEHRARSGLTKHAKQGGMTPNASPFCTPCAAHTARQVPVGLALGNNAQAVRRVCHDKLCESFNIHTILNRLMDGQGPGRRRIVQQVKHHLVVHLVVVAIHTNQATRETGHTHTGHEHQVHPSSHTSTGWR